MTLTLLLGGARSGKSAMAERLAAATGGPVLFVATMEGRDDETRERIRTHRAQRPTSWRTVEAPMDVLQALRDHARPGDCVILDCLTLLVSNKLLEMVDDIEDPPRDSSQAAADICARIALDLIDWAEARHGELIVVTNEVGSGVVPAYPLGRLFRDVLGRVNALVARRADRVYYLTAGLAMELKALGAMPVDSLGQGTPE